MKNVFLPETLESKATRVSQEEVVKKQTGMQTQNKGENGYRKKLGKGMYTDRNKLKINLREGGKGASSFSSLQQRGEMFENLRV